MSEVPTISASFIAITVILSTIVAGTVVGNFFVIVAILVDKNLQTTANQLVLSLAVADLMVACLVMPLGAYNDIHQGWYLSKEVCEFWTSADVLCCTASILNLLAIALDRYWAVTNVDYIYRRTRRRVNVMILCAWTVGAVVSLAPIFGWKDPDFANRVLEEHKCMVSQDVAYQIFATISTFYAPLVLLLALYWRIFQVARKRIRRKPGRQQALRVTTATGAAAAPATSATAAGAPGSPDAIGAPKQVEGSLSSGQTSGRLAGRPKVWPVGAAPAEEEPSRGLAVVTWVRPPGQGAKESERQMTISSETGNETCASPSGVQMDDNNKNNELPTGPQRAASFPARDREEESKAPHRLHSATHWRPPLKGPPEKPLGACAGRMAPPGSSSDSWPYLGHCRRLELPLPGGQWSADDWNSRAMIEKPNFTSTTKAKLAGQRQAAAAAQVQPAPPHPCLCPGGAATGSLGAIGAARGRRPADKAGRPVERASGPEPEPSGVDSGSHSWLARLAAKRRERPGRGACPGSGAEHEGMLSNCESCGPANDGAGRREPACTGCCCAYCSACELCPAQQQQQPYLSDTCTQCGARPSQLVGVERAEAGPQEGRRGAGGKGGGGDEHHLSGLEEEGAQINHGPSGSPSMAGASAVRYMSGRAAAGSSHSAAAADSSRGARDEGGDKPDQTAAGPEPARALGAPGCPGCGAGGLGAHFGGRWPGDLSGGVAVPVAAPKTSGSPHKVAPGQCGASRSGSLSSLSCSLAWPTGSPQRAAPASTAGSLAPTTEAASLTGRPSSNCDSNDHADNSDEDDRTSNGQRGEREGEEESDEWPPASEPSASLSAPFPPPLHLAPAAPNGGAGSPSGAREQVSRRPRRSAPTSGSESPGARSGSANTDLDSQDSLDGGARLAGRSGGGARPTTTPPRPSANSGASVGPNSIEQKPRRADGTEAGSVAPSGQAPAAISPVHSSGANNQVVSSVRRQLAETQTGAGDMKKELAKDNRAHVNDKLRPTRAQTSGPQTRRHAFLRGQAVSAPNTVHGATHKDRPDLDHCHSHEHQSTVELFFPGPGSRPGPAPLADAHAHPAPIRPARSLDIRRKFRAMGQLVSFFQTSKSVHSNSPTSASSSHAGHEACLFVLSDGHTHPLASGPEGAGGANQADQPQQVATLLSLSVQAHLDEERGTLPPTSNHLKVVARQEGRQQLPQQQGAKEPNVPASRAQGTARPADISRPDLAVRVRSPTNATFAARCNGRTRTEHMDIRREKKAAKTLAIITGVFVCCWLPFFLNAIIMPICGPACTPSDLILSILLWLGYLNSLLNPIIYTIFSPDFRRAFRRLLCLPQLIRLAGR